MKHTLTNEKRTKLLLLVAAGALLTVLAVFLWRTGLLQQCTSAEGLRAAIESYQPWSALVFFCMQLCSVIIAPIPSNLVALAGGLCFGVWQGFLMTFFAVNIASSVTFCLGRGLGRNAVQRLLQTKLPEKYQNLLHRKRDSFLIIAFLFPFFPDDILCIVASFTEISWKRFALIVLCTRHWGLLAASALGSSLFVLPSWAIPLVVVLGVGLAVLGLVYGDRVEDAIISFFHERKQARKEKRAHPDTDAGAVSPEDA